MPHARIGVSGWRYPSWRGDFYPKGLPQRLELTYAAERMTSIEVNGSFYSLQRPSSYAAWRAAVPADVVLAVKGGRFITHMKALRDVETPLANFFASGVLALGAQLGPVLWQLPERVWPSTGSVWPSSSSCSHARRARPPRLAARHDDKLAEDRVADDVRGRRPVRHALEPRHESFDSDEARALCAEHGVAHGRRRQRGPLAGHATTRRATSATCGCTARPSSTRAATPTRPSTGGPRRAGTGSTRGTTSTSTSTTTPRVTRRYDAVRLVRRLGLSTTA